MKQGRARGVEVEPLERRCLLAGVTLVTHGYGGSTAGWVTAMGNLFAQRSGPLANQPLYKMTVTDPGHDGGPLAVSSSRLGPAPANWASAEITVLLDWSDVAGSFPFGYTRATGAVGAAVGSKLLAPLSIPDVAAPLAQLPLHLIGHSRGASLISEVAATLATRGAWVDQLTYLDPHPVDGVKDPFGFDFGDAPMRVTENVVFADNYWRTDGDTSSDFTGEPVSGAADLQLTESVMAGSGYSSGEHSDVHLWYHGTIGPPFSNSDGGATVGANWYSAPHPARDSSGYRYTRLAASGVRPAAGLKTAGAPRDAVALAVSGANVWDNVQINGLLSDVVMTQGTPLNLNARFEDRAVGGARDATITIGFDRDDNPYNGFFGTGETFAASSLSGDLLAAELPTTGIAGGFRVFAKITNGTTSRYYYAPGRAIVTAAGFDKTWIGPASGGLWSDASRWSTAGAPSTGDRVAIYDSDVQLHTATNVDAVGLVAANLSVSTGGSNTFRARELVIESNATLHLADNDLLIDYTGDSPYLAIRDYVADGRITTLATGDTTLAVVDNAIWGQADFGDESIDETTIIGKYTFFGDADLDSVVTSDDYVAVDVNLGVGPGTRQWIHGDFDMDGSVTSDDYVAIDVNLGKGANNLLADFDDPHVKPIEPSATIRYKLKPFRRASSRS